MSPGLVAMRRLRVLLAPWALVLAASLAPAASARADDLAEAAIPLHAYLQGHATGQEHHFRRAFAKDGVLIGLRDGVYARRSAEEYIAQSASGAAPADEARRRRRIASLVVTGGVASAVIELDYPHMKARDHMSLLRFEDGWRIVAKVYDASTPAENPQPAAAR